MFGSSFILFYKRNEYEYIIEHIIICLEGWRTIYYNIYELIVRESTCEHNSWAWFILHFWDWGWRYLLLVCYLENFFFFLFFVFTKKIKESHENIRKLCFHEYKLVNNINKFSWVVSNGRHRELFTNNNISNEAN